MVSDSLQFTQLVVEEMATHSCILSWKIPWTGEPGGLQFMGSASGTTEQLSTHAHTQLVGGRFITLTGAFALPCTSSSASAQDTQRLLMPTGMSPSADSVGGLLPGPPVYEGTWMRSTLKCALITPLNCGLMRTWAWGDGNCL